MTRECTAWVLVRATICKNLHTGTVLQRTSFFLRYSQFSCCCDRRTLPIDNETNEPDIKPPSIVLHFHRSLTWIAATLMTFENSHETLGLNYIRPKWLWYLLFWFWCLHHFKDVIMNWRSFIFKIMQWAVAVFNLTFCSAGSPLESE